MTLLLAIKSMSVEGGGAERVLADLVNYLVSKEYDVHLLTFDRSEDESFYLLDEGIHWHQMGIGKADQKATLAETSQRIRAMRRFIRQLEPDVVVGFMHSSYVPLSFALIGTGIPVIGSEHIVAAHYDTRRFEYLLLTLSAFFIRRFTVLSDKIGRAYPWMVRRKMVAMPNPVSAGRGAIRRNERERKVVLTVGRLEAQKDQLTLLRAFAKLADDFPAWDLRIVGEGSLRPQLDAEISTLALGKRVQLPGSVAEIYNEYANADLFILSSRYESFGLATAEAMAHGLAVIGFSDCLGTDELIRDGVNGILVDPTKRVENLAQVMTALMQDAAQRERFGKQGEEAIARFAPEKIFERWEALLSKKM